MTLNNHVIPFHLGKNTVRGNIVRLQTVVSEILKRHEYPEKIESLSKHVKQFKKDKHSSVGLLRAVNRRKKLLDYLKKNNMESYKAVLTKLNLRK